MRSIGGADREADCLRERKLKHVVPGIRDGVELDTPPPTIPTYGIETLPRRTDHSGKTERPCPGRMNAGTPDSERDDGDPAPTEHPDRGTVGCMKHSPLAPARVEEHASVRQDPVEIDDDHADLPR